MYRCSKWVLSWTTPRPPRLFLLQDSGRRLQLLAETFHHKRCVLKVHAFTHEAPSQRR